MKKLQAIIFIIAGFLGWIAQPSWAAEKNDPVALLQSLANRMITNLKEHKATLKTDRALVYSLAYKIVVPHADLDEMSQRVLPPQTWNNASSTQRAEFEREFTQLLVHTYSSALADYTDQTVRFYPVRGSLEGKDNITVNSQIIRPDGPPVSVSYRLRLKGSEWKLYDMTVEGVSLLQSFQEQFRQKISEGADIVKLINDLRQHNAQRLRGRS